jgi:hypothetical protein
MLNLDTYIVIHALQGSLKGPRERLALPEIEHPISIKGASHGERDSRKGAKMKTLAISLILFGLLTVASVAAVPAASPTLAVADAPAEVEISEEFLCKLSQTTAIVLPDSTPAPNPAVAVCGACSGYQCSNRNVGAFCSGGYNPTTGEYPVSGWCLDSQESACPSDGRPFCQCLTEYQ